MTVVFTVRGVICSLELIVLEKGKPPIILRIGRYKVFIILYYPLSQNAQLFPGRHRQDSGTQSGASPSLKFDAYRKNKEGNRGEDIAVHMQ